MNSVPIKGEDGILFIFDATANDYEPIACLTSYTIQQSQSIIESNTKCAPGVTVKIRGIKNYNISFDGQFIQTTGTGIPAENVGKESFDALLVKQDLDSVFWKIDTGAGDVVYFGEGILGDLSLTQGSGDELSTFSGTLEGSGQVGIVDLAPIT